MLSMRVGQLSRLHVVFPLIFSLVAFILAMICLFAGTGPQQQALEDYHIIAVGSKTTSPKYQYQRLTALGS